LRVRAARSRAFVARVQPRLPRPAAGVRLAAGFAATGLRAAPVGAGLLLLGEVVFACVLRGVAGFAVVLADVDLPFALFGLCVEMSDSSSGSCHSRKSSEEAGLSSQRSRSRRKIFS